MYSTKRTFRTSTNKSKRHRSQSLSKRKKRLRLEMLESRLLLHGGSFNADGDLGVCMCGVCAACTGRHAHGDLHEAHALFAPGTSPEYVGLVEARAHEQAHINEALWKQYSESELAPIAHFQFDDGSRWDGTTQSGGGLGQGDVTLVTWSIVPDGTNINGFAGEATSPSNLVSTFRGIYGIADNPGDTNYFGEAWFEAIASSFDRWSEISGLSYIYEPNDDGANFAYNNGVAGIRGDVRIGGHTIDGNSGTLAYNFFPNTSDMVIDTADSFYSVTTDNSLRLRNVIMHEAGHGLGISHVESNNGSFLMEPFINLGFDGPQFDDILASHRGYGDALEGNDTPSSATSLGVIGDGQLVTIGSDGVDLSVSPTELDFVSIDDDSDVDYYSFTVSDNASVDVLLDPVGPTYNQGSQGGTQSVFVASAQNDLRIEIRDSNGTTILGQADSGGLGSSELLSDLSLPGAGEYFVAVRGVNNAAQMYRLELGVTSSAPTPGVSIVESGGSTEVTEDGATDTYSIVLDAPPTSDVIIFTNPDGQVNADPTSLTFNQSNWANPQTVTVSGVDDGDVEGLHTGAVSHTIASSDAAYQGINVATVVVDITDNDAPPPAEELYFSLQRGSVLDGLSVSDEDIVAWDGSNFRTIFDGSDVGLAGLEIDAFDVISDVGILISFSGASGGVDDSDILYFEATSLGPNTAGSFFWYLDGSDVALTRNGEDIDGITLLDDGSLLLSTSGSSRVSGLRFRDEDIVRFVPSQLGSTTSGTFQEFADGSDSQFGLADSNGEDIDGIAVKDSKLFLSTRGNFAVPGGVSGADDDVFVFDTSTNSYDPEKFLNLSGDDISGLDFAGVATASSIGIGNAGAFTNPYVDYDQTPVKIGGQGGGDSGVDSSFLKPELFRGRNAVQVPRSVSITTAEVAVEKDLDSYRDQFARPRSRMLEAFSAIDGMLSDTNRGKIDELATVLAESRNSIQGDATETGPLQDRSIQEVVAEIGGMLS